MNEYGDREITVWLLATIPIAAPTGFSSVNIILFVCDKYNLEGTDMYGRREINVILLIVVLIPGRLSLSFDC